MSEHVSPVAYSGGIGRSTPGFPNYGGRPNGYAYYAGQPGYAGMYDYSTFQPYYDYQNQIQQSYYYGNSTNPTTQPVGQPVYSRPSQQVSTARPYKGPVGGPGAPRAEYKYNGQGWDRDDPNRPQTEREKLGLPFQPDPVGGWSGGDAELAKRQQWRKDVGRLEETARAWITMGYDENEIEQMLGLDHNESQSLWKRLGARGDLNYRYQDGKKINIATNAPYVDWEDLEPWERDQLGREGDWKSELRGAGPAGFARNVSRGHWFHGPKGYFYNIPPGANPNDATTWQWYDAWGEEAPPPVANWTPDSAAIPTAGTPSTTNSYQTGPPPNPYAGLVGLPALPSGSFYSGGFPGASYASQNAPGQAQASSGLYPSPMPLGGPISNPGSNGGYPEYGLPVPVPGGRAPMGPGIVEGDQPYPKGGIPPLPNPNPNDYIKDKRGQGNPSNQLPYPTTKPYQINAAKGFSGVVNRPTNLTVGEGGEPEIVQVIPASQVQPSTPPPTPDNPTYGTGPTTYNPTNFTPAATGNGIYLNQDSEDPGRPLGPGLSYTSGPGLVYRGRVKVPDGEGRFVYRNIYGPPGGVTNTGGSGIPPWMQAAVTTTQNARRYGTYGSGPDLSTQPYSGGTRYNPQYNFNFRPSGPGQQEMGMYSAITELARMLQGQGQGLYDVGMPAYAQAIDYYRALLGSRGASQAATAPSAELIREQYEGARQQANNLSGGARDNALGGLLQGQARDIAHLTQGVQGEAANALMQGGLQGASLGGELEQASASTYANILSQVIGSRISGDELALKAESLRLDDAHFSAQLDETIRSNNLSYNQAMSALALNKYLQESQLAENIRQFGLNFGFRQNEFNEGIRQFYLNYGLNQQQIAFQRQQYRDAQRRQTGSTIGRLFGKGLGAVGIATGNPWIGYAGSALSGLPMPNIPGRSSRPNPSYSTGSFNTQYGSTPYYNYGGYYGTDL